MKALKILMLVSVWACLLVEKCFSLLKSSIASPVLLLMLFSVSNSEPRYLKDFHSSEEYMEMVHSSVLSTFTTRFRVCGLAGIVFLMYWMKKGLVVALPASSAYWWSMLRWSISLYTCGPVGGQVWFQWYLVHLWFGVAVIVFIRFVFQGFSKIESGK